MAASVSIQGGVLILNELITCTSQSFSCHLSLSIPPENIRKPLVVMFSRGVERDKWHEIG